MRRRERVAIVTGAGFGIGRAIAPRLAAEGAPVVVANRNLEGGQVTVAEIEARGVARFVETDVARAIGVRHIVAAARDAFGQVDILVNNAA